MPERDNGALKREKYNVFSVKQVEIEWFLRYKSVNGIMMST